MGNTRQNYPRWQPPQHTHLQILQANDQDFLSTAYPQTYPQPQSYPQFPRKLSTGFPQLIPRLIHKGGWGRVQGVANVTVAPQIQNR